MKKKHSTLRAFIIKCIILFAFWLIIYVMLHVFSTLKADSVHDTVKENLLGSSAEQVAFFEVFTQEREPDNIWNILVPEKSFYDISSDRIYGYTWFFDSNDREWVEEYYGSFPRLEKDSLSEIRYYSELTAGEFMGHTGYCTTVTEAFPENITLNTDIYLHNRISWIGLAFMLIIAISSIVVYNKSRVDTRSAENVLIKGLSHDLKRPLETLKVTAEEWARADNSEKNALSANVISDVSRMDSIIRKQLKLRDLSSGKIDLKTEEIDLHYMLKKVIGELRPAFSKRKIDIVDNSVSDDEYIVNADPQLMQLVISNMLLVAADNTEKQIAVKVCPGGKHKKSEYVRLSIGCADELFRNLVSGPFWSVVTDSDSKRTASFGSRGVGMATLVPILKAHDAKYGNNGNGPEACFWIELKKVEDE